MINKIGVKVLGGTCHCVHPKSHTDWPGRWKEADRGNVSTWKKDCPGEVTYCPTDMSRGLAGYRTRVWGLRNQRLTTLLVNMTAYGHLGFKRRVMTTATIQLSES